MHIRHENIDDHETISRIHYAAFKGHPQHETGVEPVEHLIVERLREANALTLSLVAEEGNEVVGHIAFSMAAINGTNKNWHLLGPVGVTPERQGAGVGSELILNSLEILREQGASGCVLVGDPGFYQRFGFQSLEGLTYPGVPDQYVLAFSFGDVALQGAITAHEAFGL